MIRSAKLLLLLSLLLIGCAPTRPPVPAGVIPTPHPVTAEEEQYGHTILSQLSEQYQLDFNDPRMDMVNRVVDKLTKAAGVDKSPWHVYLFKDSSVKNAAATRGNHVFIWSGMLDFAPTEQELSTVLAHELAHVLAGHTDPDPNEEFKNIMIQVGAAAVGIALSATTRDPYLGQNIGNLGAAITEQVGSGVLVNPYSQMMELEADQIGLMIMAKARYNPQAAIDFWTKMERDPSASTDLQFFSTHPPAEERLSKLKQALPLAQAYFRGEAPNLALAPPLPPPEASGKYRELPREPQVGPIGGPIDPADPDNFARIDAPRGSIENLGPRIHRKGYWRVVADNSPIYREPTDRSETIGSLRQGDLIDGEEEQRGGWVHLLGPQPQYSSPGYVRRLSLERAFKVD